MSLDERVLTDPSTVVAELGLEPHPEGGWYRRVWESERRHHPTRERPAGSAIHYLLEAGGTSAWHRVRDADELWHHLAGGPLELRLSRDGREEQRVLLGDDPATGAASCWGVPANCWQAARAITAPVLVLCVVTPAFEFRQFDLAPEGWEPAGPAAPGT